MSEIFSGVETIKYKGVVTSVDSNLCRFAVDGTYHVLTCFLECVEEGIPKVNDEISLTNVVVYNERTFVLAPNGTLSTSIFDDYNIERVKKFSRIVRNHRLAISDVLHLWRLHDTWTSLRLFPETDIVDVFLCLLEAVPNFRDVAIKTPTYFEYDDYKPYDCCPEYMFACRRNEIDTVLLGYVIFSDDKKRLAVSDGRYDLACVTDDVDGCLDRFVVIKKYRVITEMFEESRPLTYLFFKASNVTVLKLGCAVESTECGEEVSCRVVHKGPICKEERAECWVLIESDDARFSRCLVRSEGFLEFYPAIKNGCRMVITAAEGLVDRHLTTRTELRRIYPSLPIYTLPATIGVKITKCPPEHVPNLSKLFHTTQESTDPVSFLAIISEKYLTKPLASRTNSGHHDQTYGTPGSKTHTLKLRDVSDPYFERLMYLNNWEKIMCPLGLIVDMVVIVRHACAHRNYYKSNALTTFEIVDFCPEIDYSSSNFFEDVIDWGPLNALGVGDKLPPGIVCWCPVSRLQIQTLKVESTCLTCHITMKLAQGKCCERDRFKTNYWLSFKTLDHCGPSMIQTTKLDVLRYILGLEESRWAFIKKGLQGLRTYEYKIDEKDKWEEEAGDNEMLSMVLKLLNDTLSQVSDGQVFVDLKCGNLGKSPETDASMPSWFCLEARSSKCQ